MATCGCGRKGSNVRTLYEDPHFTFRFADDRLIPRFHLDGDPAGQPVSVFRIVPAPANARLCWRRQLWVTAAGLTWVNRSS